MSEPKPPADRVEEIRCWVPTPGIERVARQAVIDLLAAYDALRSDHEALMERLEKVGEELIQERLKARRIATSRWYQGDRLDSASRHAKEMGES